MRVIVPTKLALNGQRGVEFLRVRYALMREICVHPLVDQNCNILEHDFLGVP